MGLQVGANRNQISSDKWWEGAFNTAVHIIDHEVNFKLLSMQLHPAVVAITHK